MNIKSLIPKMISTTSQKSFTYPYEMIADTRDLIAIPFKTVLFLRLE